MRNLRSSSGSMNTLLVPIRLVHAMRSDRDSGGESRPRRCTSACAASRSLSSQSGGRADFAPNPIIKTVNMSAIRLHTTPSHSRTSIARMLRTASDIEAPPLTGVHLCPRPRRRTELYGPGRTVTLRAADSWPCQVIRTFAGGPRPHQLRRSSHQAAKTGQRSRTASRPASARPSGGAELDRADLFSGILYLRPSGGESGSGRPGRG